MAFYILMKDCGMAELGGGGGRGGTVVSKFAEYVHYCTLLHITLH